MAACAAPPAREPIASYRAVDFATLEGWMDDNLAEALPVLARSCAVFAKMPADRAIGRFGSARDWQKVCAILPASPDPDAARAFFAAEFRPWQILADGEAEGLFTGYYEASLRASRTRHGPYQTPLYARPDDLLTADLGAFRDDWRGKSIAGKVVGRNFVPYDDRATIIARGLSGRTAPLLWADDPVDAFFLEIQGSGRATLDDGRIVQIGFAAQNGHPYVPIGRVLKEMNAFPDGVVTMQRIRAWLAAHPTEAQAMMNRNPSYVFFQLREDGPLGAQGVVLTPRRSLAVDRRSTPYGAPVWLDAAHPDGGRLRRLFIAQDTGGAIRGPVRGDVFWGHGADAADIAGRMQSRGRMFVLLPRDVMP